MPKRPRKAVIMGEVACVNIHCQSKYLYPVEGISHFFCSLAALADGAGIALICGGVDAGNCTGSCKQSNNEQGRGASKYVKKGESC
jgi:hypothetical protein